MAIRIRADRKTIICAAKSKEETGDIYINDGLHYVLGVELQVLSVCGHTSDGADLWEFHAPITMDEKIIKEGLSRQAIGGQKASPSVVQERSE